MLQSTFAGNAPAEIATAVDALADPQARIVVLGGRFSHVLADQLAHYLSVLRPGVTCVAAGTGGRLASLLDCGPETVAVVFDFRRYQASSIDWGREAKARGARLILVTDQVLSPLAPSADILVTAATSGPQPFPSMLGAFAMVELMISETAARLGAPAGNGWPASLRCRTAMRRHPNASPLPLPGKRAETRANSRNFRNCKIYYGLTDLRKILNLTPASKGPARTR